MRHIGIDAAAFHLTDKIAAFIGQSPLSLLAVGAGQRIGPVPNRVEESHAPIGHGFDLMYITFDQIGALYAQQGCHFPVFYGAVDLRAGAAMADEIGVCFHFLHKAIMQPPALRPHTVLRRIRRVKKQGKKLTEARKLPASHKVNMPFIFTQAAALGKKPLLFLRVFPEIQRHFPACHHTAVDGVTVGVKIRYWLQSLSPQNASSQYSMRTEVCSLSV